jgi:hypothetical protein
MTQTDHTTDSLPSLIERAADDRGRNGSGVLLGLEPQTSLSLENAGQNLSHLADLDGQPCHAPLLGTSTSQVLEISRGSSKKRSPESICYTKLLRENGPSSGRKSRKTAPIEDRVCYGKLSQPVDLG